MVPGAEAVRPLAAGQSMRAGEILSELVSPAPAVQAPLPSIPDEPAKPASEPVSETASGTK